MATDRKVLTYHGTDYGELEIVVDARPGSMYPGALPHMQLRMATTDDDLGDDDYQCAYYNFCSRDDVQRLIDALESARDVTFPLMKEES